MNNREFIELLNLYLDHEISPEDALRLEAEVVSNPERRKVYQQYCRMQKACTLLAGELTAEAPEAGTVVAFPSRSPWRFGSLAAGLAAAAACMVGIVGLRNHTAAPAVAAVAAPAPQPAREVAVAVPVDTMKPVFNVPLPARSSAALMVSADRSQQMAPLNWIGSLHLAPVYATPNTDFNLSGKTDLKAAAINDPQGDRDDQEPAEMTAFRFQR